MKIASILITLFLIVSVLSYTEADSSLSFLIRVRHKKDYIFQQTLDVFLDPKFFELEKNHLPIKIDIPRHHINQSYLQVQYSIPGQSKPVPNSKRIWKITNLLPVSNSKLGIDVLFSLDDIITSKQLNIKEVYPEKAYLKIVNDKKAFKALMPDYCIDQSIMLNAKEFTPSEQNTKDVISILLVPELFQNNNFAQSTIYSLLKAEYHRYEQYFLKSYNKKLNKDEIKAGLAFYENSIKEVDDLLAKLRKKLPSNPSVKTEIDLMLVQRKALVNYMEQLQILTSEEEGAEMLNHAKSILLLQSYDSLQLLKKYIFFNSNGFYTLVFICFAIQMITFQIIKIMLLVQIKDYISSYKDHEGVSLIPFYLIVLYCIISLFAESLSSGFCTILLFYFLEPIMRLKFQSVTAFPFYKLEVNMNYKKHESMDYFLLFVIGLIMLGLMAGYSIFSEKAQTSFDEDTIIPLPVDALSIIISLLNKYFIFFIGMSQAFVNRRLKSVRHLTTRYVVMYAVLAVLDNYLFLLHTQPFGLLFFIKQDIFAVILIYQCFQYADLGQGSRAYFRELQLSQQMEKRRVQISQANKKIE